MIAPARRPAAAGGLLEGSVRRPGYKTLPWAGRELTTVLLLGVLLPICFSRPPFLKEHPMRPHLRRRWNLAYTITAFAAIGFVYVSCAYLFQPLHGITQSTRSALSVAGLLLFVIACAHHIPPLLTDARPRSAVACGVLSGLALGLVAGGFLAVDAIFAQVKYPQIALGSWAVLILLTAGTTVAYSGLSPETQLKFYARRRQHARQRRAQA